MQKTRKVKHASPVKPKVDSAKVKITETITDQNAGLQQLYENRKTRPSTKRKPEVADPKQVRQNSSEKLDKLLRRDGSDAEQRETSTEITQTEKLNKQNHGK
jgi:hypothetical protein